MSQQFELLYLENLDCSWRVVDAKTREILDWKQSKEVKDSHNKLFTEDTAIEEITNSLVNTDDEKFNDMYIYTAFIFDIILNPNCSTLEISKTEMEL